MLRAYIALTHHFFILSRISRGENKQSTDFHFFTSHFYTTLSKEGPTAVQSWSAKKNIDLFRKRLIFVPINKDLHWSLCVIVNPGAALLSSSKNTKKDDAFSCLLFLDSKKMHAPSKVQEVISDWLNAEWQQRTTQKTERTHYLKAKMLPLFSPPGKFSYDSLLFHCSIFSRCFYYSFSSLPAQWLGLRSFCLSVCICNF